MSRSKTETIKCTHFVWSISTRNEVWQADGRANSPSTGRHSLRTRDHQEAIDNLHKLDAAIAVGRGLAQAPATTTGGFSLPLDHGVKLYFDYCARSPVLKGISQASIARYRAVFDKFVPYLKQKGIGDWNQVTKDVVVQYVTWLHKGEYAYGTELFEVTAIKTAVNWWIKEKHLTSSAKIDLPMSKSDESHTYCYRSEEVEAMLKLCYGDRSLIWLGDVISAAAYSGMRISEIAQLTWSCVDLEKKMLTVLDESKTVRARNKNVTTTKGKRTRHIPIQEELRKVLERLAVSKEGKFVFRAQQGAQLRPNNALTSMKKRVIKPLKKQFPSGDDEAGFKDGRIHSLRHFFCSLCAHRAVPEQVVMRWLGHRDSMIVKRYYHLHDEEAQRQMQKLGSLGDSGAK